MAKEVVVLEPVSDLYLKTEKLIFFRLAFAAVGMFLALGINLFTRTDFDYLGGDECIFEREPLERLARDGQLMAFRHDGFFYAMDTYREYQALNELWNRGAAPWRVWA